MLKGLLSLAIFMGSASALAQVGGGRTAIGGGGDPRAIKIYGIANSIWNAYHWAFSFDYLRIEALPKMAQSRIDSLMGKTGQLEVIVESRLFIREEIHAHRWTRISQAEFEEAQKLRQEPGVVVREVSAINYPVLNMLYISYERWKTHSDNERIFLLFHELVSLGNVQETPHYRYTRSFMNWLARNPGQYSYLVLQINPQYPLP
ncbi:MAG TPA: hypothetical protein VM901_10970 [Bdellovibrionota bacterium]|jgi:hypothetical protein|nr:hypothetical protein [Bdellovibrionota bacterium]